MQGYQAHKKYQSVQVSTVDRGRLLLMLYDGCLKFLRHARDGLETKDRPKFAKFLSKAQAIIVELMSTLDHEKGGSIAQDLERLYDFMMFYLTEANLQSDISKINKVISLLERIAGAYRQVIESGDAASQISELAVKEALQSANSPEAERPAAEEESTERRINISL